MPVNDWLLVYICWSDVNAKLIGWKPVKPTIWLEKTELFEAIKFLMYTQRAVCAITMGLKFRVKE